jgi:hypothetical protein
MFTKGFKKTAFDANAPVGMPDPVKARAAAAGAENGQSLSKGWANMKSELGGLFGSTAKNVGKMGS